MKKIKYREYITEDKVDDIIKRKYPDKICPQCKQKSLYAAAPETQYDDKNDDYVVLSFDIFCQNCGQFLAKWDNTYRKYFFSD